MDYEWARQQLEDFVRHSADWWTADINVNPARAEAEVTVLLQKAPVIREILRRLNPSLSHAIQPIDFNVNEARAAALEGLGALDALESRNRLGPAGPLLGADELHSWVWAAAQAFWDSRHYAQAVEQAWKSINAHIQNKVGRTDIADDALVNATLSVAPPGSGTTKLRLPGEPAHASWQSRQRGMHLLGQAAIAGIRNVLAHEDVELPETVALEYLALLSVFARWVSETVPVTSGST